jgi:hypothetical protein
VLATRVLLPQTGLIFSMCGSALYEGGNADQAGIAETHRRLAYWLEDFYDRNAPCGKPALSLLPAGNRVVAG